MSKTEPQKPAVGCGGCLLLVTALVGGGALWTKHRHTEAVLEAHKLYDAGQHDQAVAQYKTLYPDAPPEVKGVVLPRIVKAEVARGNQAEVRAWVDRGLKDGLDVAYDDPLPRELVLERKKEQAAEAERKRQEQAQADAQRAADQAARRTPRPKTAPAGPPVVLPRYEEVEFSYPKGVAGIRIAAVVSGDPTDAGLRAVLARLHRRARVEQALRGDRSDRVVAVFLYTDKEHFQDGFTWVARLLDKPGEPTAVDVNQNLIDRLGDPPVVKFGLTEARRRQFYREQAWIELWVAEQEATKKGPRPGYYRDQEELYQNGLAAQYGLTDEQVREVLAEGVYKYWASPGLEARPKTWTLPKPVPMPAPKEGSPAGRVQAPAGPARLTPEERRRVFDELARIEVYISRQKPRPADAAAMTGRYRAALAARHRLAPTQLGDIEAEAAVRAWPRPTDLPDGWKPPEPLPPVEPAAADRR